MWTSRQPSRQPLASVSRCRRPLSISSESRIQQNFFRRAKWAPPTGVLAPVWAADMSGRRSRSGHCRKPRPDAGGHRVAYADRRASGQEMSVAPHVGCHGRPCTPRWPVVCCPATVFVGIPRIGAGRSRVTARSAPEGGRRANPSSWRGLPLRSRTRGFRLRAPHRHARLRSA